MLEGTWTWPRTSVSSVSPSLPETVPRPMFSAIAGFSSALLLGWAIFALGTVFRETRRQ